MSKRFLYLIQEPDGLTKIGIAEDPRKRAMGLSSQGGRPAKVLFSVRLDDGAIGAERHLHKLYERKRYLGEWFRLDAQDLAAIITTDFNGFYRPRQSPPIYARLTPLRADESVANGIQKALMARTEASLRDCSTLDDVLSEEMRGHPRELLLALRTLTFHHTRQDMKEYWREMLHEYVTRIFNVL